MPCVERRDDLVLLALGETDLNVSELREHLATCRDCQAYLSETAETLRCFATAVAPPVTLPPDLKAGVLAHVRTAGRQETDQVPTSAAATLRVPRWLIAAMLALVLLNAALITSVWHLQRNVATLTRLVDVSSSQFAVAHDLMTLLQLPSDLTLHLAGTEAAPEAAGSAWLYESDAGQLWVVSVWNLPILPDLRQVYQVWLVDDDDRLNAGVFRVDPAGRGTIIFRANANLTFDSIGVTREPDPYGDRPRGIQVLAVQRQ